MSAIIINNIIKNVKKVTSNQNYRRVGHKNFFYALKMFIRMNVEIS